MEEMKLYDIDSAELYELIDSKKVELKTKNLEYKTLAEKVAKIKQDFPNLLSLLEDENVKELNEKECKMLQEIIKLHNEMSNFEERENFFLGARENYFYLKNLGIIKE